MLHPYPLHVTVPSAISSAHGMTRADSAGFPTENLLPLGGAWRVRVRVVVSQSHAVTVHFTSFLFCGDWHARHQCERTLPSPALDLGHVGLLAYEILCGEWSRAQSGREACPPNSTLERQAAVSHFFRAMVAGGGEGGRRCSSVVARQRRRSRRKHESKACKTILQKRKAGN